MKRAQHFVYFNLTVELFSNFNLYCWSWNLFRFFASDWMRLIVEWLGGPKGPKVCTNTQNVLCAGVLFFIKFSNIYKKNTAFYINNRHEQLSLNSRKLQIFSYVLTLPLKLVHIMPNLVMSFCIWVLKETWEIHLLTDSKIPQTVYR